MVGALGPQTVGLREVAREVPHVERGGDRGELVHDHLGLGQGDGLGDRLRVERVRHDGLRAEVAQNCCFDGLRVIPVTSCPRSASRGTSWRPSAPVAPAMKILMVSPLRTSFWRGDETASRFVTASAPVHHLEDFHPGDRFVTPEREVTEAEIVAFARRVRPAAVPHRPGRRRARSVFGRHVASGWHTAALTMRLWVDHGPQVAGGMIGLGVEELRWGPLVPGDRIRVEGEILEVRPSRSGAPRGVVRLRLRTLNQRDEEVQHMVPAILVPAREARRRRLIGRTPAG